MLKVPDFIDIKSKIEREKKDATRDAAATTITC